MNNCKWIELMEKLEILNVSYFGKIDLIIIGNLIEYEFMIIWI
jgi:hypothetical protein